MKRYRCMAMPGSGEIETYGSVEVLCLYGQTVDVEDAECEIIDRIPYWKLILDAPAPATEQTSESTLKPETKPKKTRGRRSVAKSVDSSTEVSDNPDSDIAD